jgi:hypothetical protein
VLIDRLGDNNARLRDGARETLLALARHRESGLRCCSGNSALLRPAKNQAAWRPILSTLQLLQARRRGPRGARGWARGCNVACCYSQLGACGCGHPASTLNPALTLDLTTTHAQTPFQHAHTQARTHSLPQPRPFLQDLVPLIGVAQGGGRSSGGGAAPSAGGGGGEGLDLGELMDYVGRAFGSANADVRFGGGNFLGPLGSIGVLLRDRRRRRSSGDGGPGCEAQLGARPRQGAAWERAARRAPTFFHIRPAPPPRRSAARRSRWRCWRTTRRAPRSAGCCRGT